MEKKSKKYYDYCRLHFLTNAIGNKFQIKLRKQKKNTILRIWNDSNGISQYKYHRNNKKEKKLI